VPIACVETSATRERVRFYQITDRAHIVEIGPEFYRFHRTLEYIAKLTVSPTGMTVGDLNALRRHFSEDKAYDARLGFVSRIRWPVLEVGSPNWIAMIHVYVVNC
jgi:hypothetical protein